MSMTDRDCRRFQQLWEAEYGEQLTDEQAREYGERVLRYVKRVLEEEPRERAPP